MATKLASGYVDLTVHFDQALKEIRRAFDNLDDAEIDVDANTSGATANMGRWRTKEEAKPVNLRVDVDTRMASNQVRGLRRDLEDLGRSDFLKINLGVAGIASLPALATGLAEVAASMQQLSQAALAVPGGIAGVVSSVGTLAFGLTGVADAYEALNKASDEQARSGRDAANQARSQQSASYSLRNAIVDQTQAREDLNRAVRDQRRELQDLALEQRGGVISEKRAVLEAQKARERLYSGDFSDYRDALLDVEEADLRVEEVRNRNVRTTEDLVEANSKSVEHSDRVVAANENLIRSQQGVVMAQGAVAAAAVTTTTAQEDAALAMSKLSPNAQEFVNTLMDVQGPIMALRNLVQDRIFDGLSGELQDLTGKSMPMFEKGLGSIGDAWNRSIKELLRVAGLDSNQGMLERIFGNTADAQSILNRAIEPLTEGMLTLVEAGTDALPRLADGFGDIATRFANFITAADEDGRLDQWIDEGITAFGHLGETMLNIGKIFSGITNATSGSFLQNLENWTTKWANWINSVEGQTALKDFFAEGKRVWEQWRPILEDLPGIFKRIYDAASSFSSAVSQILSPVTEVLNSVPGLVETAAMAFLIFKSAQVIGAVGALMGKLTGLSTMLGTTLPDDAKKGAGKINAALALIAVPAIGKMITDDIDEWLKENHPDLYDLNHTNTPDQLGKKARDWVDRNIFGEGRLGTPQAIDPITGLPDSQAHAPAGSRDPNSTGLPNSQARASAGTRESGGVPALYGLPAGSNSGGYGGGGVDFPDWVDQIAAAFGIKPSTYSGHQESHRNEPGYAPNPNGQNRGIDWSGPVANMQRFADYLATVPGGLEQVIWQNPGTGAAVEIAGGQAQPGYFAADLGGHQDHVHTRQSSPIPLPPWVKTYDTGGWWPDGVLGVNTTGEDELVLNPDHLDNLRKQGIDPNALLHGQTAGALPGPTPEQMQHMIGQASGPQDQVQQIADQFFGGQRTNGFIPAAAGNASVAGTSFLSQVYGMGAEVINGFIDQAASAAAGAAGAAASAFAPGSGGAASGVASAAIGMGTQAAKRGVEYVAQMAGIFTDSIIEQATPFGAPRLLTTDPTGFMPQQLLSGAMSGALGQMMPGQQEQGPQPGQSAPHQGTGAAPGTTTQAGPIPGPGEAIGKTSAPTDPAALDFLKPIIPTVHDQGGWLPAGGVAMNLTKKAEPMPVFNHEQWGTLNAIANNPIPEPVASGGPQYHYTIQATVKDVKELERQMVDRRQLDTMRYRGRM